MGRWDGSREDEPQSRISGVRSVGTPSAVSEVETATSPASKLEDVDPNVLRAMGSDVFSGIDNDLFERGERVRLSAVEVR